MDLVRNTNIKETEFNNNVLLLFVSNPGTFSWSDGRKYEGYWKEGL